MSAIAESPQRPNAAPSALPSLPPAADPIDDADALPAVGKVWDDGPKRSLSEIMASANRQRATPPAQPPRPAPARVPSDVAELWGTVLQKVQETLGPSVHVPLSSGHITRDAQQVTIRFSGPFAAMARYLDKHRDAIQQIFGEVAGLPLALRFEIDENAPAPAPVQPPQPRSSTQPSSGGQAAHAAQPAPAAAGREGVPITPELRSQLEQDPLIRAVMEQLNGTIVKVEQ